MCIISWWRDFTEMLRKLIKFLWWSSITQLTKTYDFWTKLTINHSHHYFMPLTQNVKMLLTVCFDLIEVYWNLEISCYNAMSSVKKKSQLCSTWWYFLNLNLLKESLLRIIWILGHEIKIWYYSIISRDLKIGSKRKF